MEHNREHHKSEFDQNAANHDIALSLVLPRGYDDLDTHFCGSIILQFFFILGFFNSVVCVSPVQVILETLIDIKRNFVKFTVKCLNCGNKVGIASMCAEPQAKPKLNFYRVPTHF